MVALQALSMFGGRTFTGEGQLVVMARGEDTTVQVEVTPSNSLLYQAEQLAVSDTSVEIFSRGSGCALVQVSSTTVLQM